MSNSIKIASEMKNKQYKILLGILVVVIISMNYSYLDGFLIKNFTYEEKIKIDRVIDGDTVVVNGTSFRLLGINTPERGEYLYEEAKNFLEEKVLNKTLIVERRDKDRYGRELVYLYYGNENINKNIVEEGYANYYFPEGKDIHYKEFVSAWEECLKENKNLCEKSIDICSSCIGIYDWNFEEQTIIFYNNCGFDCSLKDWTLKDEGRKKFVFEEFVLEKDSYASIIVGEGEDSKNKLYWIRKDYVWTNSGDSFFLRDNENKLVLWKSENY